jgi:hypothetical protein
MKCIHLPNAVLSVCDMPGNEIIVDGKAWRFDFDRQLGPLWLKKDGTERSCQNPSRRVWKAFECWLKESA